jgi:hypothetical protein
MDITSVPYPVHTLDATMLGYKLCNKRKITLYPMIMYDASLDISGAPLDMFDVALDMSGAFYISSLIELFIFFPSVLTLRYFAKYFRAISIFQSVFNKYFYLSLCVSLRHICNTYYSNN